MLPLTHLEFYNVRSFFILPECILPGTLSNGEIKPNADKSTLYYYCNIGFSLSTTTFIRECMQDGTGWSGVEPACRKSEHVSPIYIFILSLQILMSQSATEV